MRYRVCLCIYFLCLWIFLISLKMKKKNQDSINSFFFSLFFLFFEILTTLLVQVEVAKLLKHFIHKKRSKMNRTRKRVINSLFASWFVRNFIHFFFFLLANIFPCWTESESVIAKDKRKQQSQFIYFYAKKKELWKRKVY